MIAHIDTGKDWRGGQQQSFYLHEQLIKNNYNSIMFCKKGSIMALKCNEMVLPYQELPFITELDIYSAIKIALYSKKNNIKLLHLHTAHAVSIGLMVKCLHRIIKLIAVRRVDFSIKKSFFSIRKYKNNFIDKIICISKNIYSIMLSDGINKEKLCIIHSGIDVKRYFNLNKENYKYQLNIPQNNIIIGTIAALTGHKDYPTLLKAVKIVLSKYDNVTFIAVGDGKLKSELDTLHKELELNDKFIFAGFQSDIAKYLALFDIFVLSSKLEGLGTSVLDAMSARKPIVACESGGIPEMIKHNVNGLLAEKQNPDDIAQKLLILINDDKLRQRLAEQAEIDVKAFSIQNTYHKNIELYKEFGILN